MEDEEGVEDVEKEPQVTSSDPNERKLARKLRIERRLEAIRKLNLPEGEEESIIVEKTLLQEQLEKSYELLEKLTLDANELVTNVRIANDVREIDRRDVEGIRREKIIAGLEEEAQKAEDKFKEIADKWLSIFEYNDPLHINDDINEQKEKCDDLIQQKDEFIAMLKNQIRTSEINFSKDQRKQTQDIETLASRIEKQVVLMRRAYRHELQMIEDVIETERKILLESNDKRWEELYKKRDQEEQSNSDKKFEQLEEFDEMCNDLRVDFQEKYRETKIKLENDIESLQRDLEEIKIMCLMNNEKLDYNFQVMNKREDENIIIKSQQKRRINKFQDMINLMRNKNKEYETQTNNEIERLTTEVRKLQWNILDIERSADHFSKSNDKRYKEVWEMNQKIATDILDQILATDKVLHQQQLGLEWVHPEQYLLDKSDLPSYISASKTVSELRRKETENKPLDGAKSSISETEVDLVPEGETMAHRRLLRQILKHIADKSGFLVEGRLKEILKEHIETEETLVKVDCAFMALGIKRPEDIEIMLEFFLPYTTCPICSVVKSVSSSEIEIKTESYDGSFGFSTDNTCSDMQSTSQAHSIALTNVTTLVSTIRQPHELIKDIIEHAGDEEGVSEKSSGENSDCSKTMFKVSTRASMASTKSKLSCQNNHPLVISPVYILRALKEFVSRFYVAKPGMIAMASRLSYKRSTISRLMIGQDVKTYWDRFKKVFSSPKIALWDGLMIGLHKYHEILKDRRKLSEDVTRMRRQNVELKYLLSCYEKDLEKKLKPPCAVDRANPIQPERL